MAISKIVYKESANATPVTWMDATPATAAAADITAPKTAMLADGVMTTGTGSGGGGGGGLLTPDYQGLSYGYLASYPANFMWPAANKTIYLNLYPLKSGKTYVLFILGDTAADQSNRRRFAFFAGKTFDDFEPYIDVGGGTAYTIYTSNWSYTADSDNPYTHRLIYTPNADGEMAIVTSTEGVAVNTYCVEIP